MPTIVVGAAAILATAMAGVLVALQTATGRQSSNLTGRVQIGADSCQSFVIDHKTGFISNDQRTTCAEAAQGVQAQGRETTGVRSRSRGHRRPYRRPSQLFLQTLKTMKSERPTMDEELYRSLGWGRRKSLRRHFGYPSQLHFGEGAPPQVCVIVDMSESGAQLQVPADVAVPGEFSLLIGGNSHVRRHCKLVWRSGNRMGVEFRVGVKTSTRDVGQQLGANGVATTRTR